MAYALIGLAMAGHGGADPGWSARLHGAADQALADLGHALEPLEGRLADLRPPAPARRDGRRGLRGRIRRGPRPRPGAGARRGPAHGEPAGGHGSPGCQRSAGALVSEPDAAASGEAASVLTPRELDVLKLVAQGLSNPDIAQRLVLSEHTVHRHLANILRKLGLSSRAAAAAWGVRTGLV